MSSSSNAVAISAAGRSYDVRDHQMRSAVAMSVHRETLYTAKTLYNTVHSFQALFDRYLGKPGSKAASAAMAVDSGISRPMGLVDALTRIESLKLEVKDLLEAVDKAKAETVLERERGQLREKAMLAVFQEERLEFSKERVRAKLAHEQEIADLKRQLRLTKANAIENLVRRKSPFYMHSILNAWRQLVVTGKLLDAEKQHVLSELGDVGLKLMKTEAKNTQLRLKYSESRASLLDEVEAEGAAGLTRFCFLHWRAVTQETKLQVALLSEQAGRTSEVTQLQLQLEDVRKAFTFSRQDFRRATLSLDKIRDDHMQLKEEVELWRAKGAAVADQKTKFDADMDELKVENVQLRAKLGEALESLAAAEAADSDLGLLFKKYRELEKEYRILKKVLYPETSEIPSSHHPTGVYQCANCRAHVVHRSNVSDFSKESLKHSFNSTVASSQFFLPPVHASSAAAKAALASSSSGSGFSPTAASQHQHSQASPAKSSWR